MNDEPQTQPAGQGPGGETPAAAPSPATRGSPVVYALLILASLAAAVAMLFVVGWITGDRFASAEGPGGPARPQPITAAEEFDLPEGAEPVPGWATGGEDAGAPPMATVPGRLNVVRSFFVQQGARKGWAFVREGPGQKRTTLSFQKRGAVRMIVILEAPSGQACTVAVYAAADPWRDRPTDPESRK